MITIIIENTEYSRSIIIAGEPHTCLLINMIIIENAVSMHTASKQWHRAPPEKMLHLVLQCWLRSTRYTAI